MTAVVTRRRRSKRRAGRPAHAPQPPTIRAAVRRHLRSRRLLAAYQAFVAGWERARREADAESECREEASE